MQVIETDGWTARCVGRDGERILRLTTLAEDVSPGDWLLAHIDSAVQTLTPEEAASVEAALEAIALTLEGGDPEAALARVMEGVILPSQQQDGQA